MSDPVSGADLLKRIRPTLAEESHQVCLRPDLIEAWEEANGQLQELVAKAARTEAGQQGARLSQKPNTAQVKAAKAVQDIEAELDASSPWFRFRALPKDVFRALCDDHPPRRDNQVDQMTGYNRDMVLDEMVRASLIDPVFDDESWAELTATLASGEWDELRKVSNHVNRGVVEPPKSVLASRILARPNSGSKSPAPGE